MNATQRTERREKPIYYLISILFGFVFVLILLEGLFRFLPVNNAPRLTRVDKLYGVNYFAPNETYKWSTGTTFAFRTSKQSNNFGFLSDYDFHPTSFLPLMVVIGDSYVEAAQVENGRAHHSLLHTGLGGHGRVYGIGSSGSPLSNYLQYAQMAKEQFSPDGMIFVIVGNDFDESMCQYYHMGVGTLCFEPIGSGDYELKRMNPPHSLLRNLARQSALMRYLVFNAKIDWRAVIARLKGKRGEEDKYIGNTAAEVSPERLKQSKNAVDEFFDRLPSASGLAFNRVSFVLDGIRQGIYEDNRDLSGSYFGLMRQYFVEQGESLGYEIIDLHQEFLRDYMANEEKFEFPIDGHWNELGHYIAASAIANSRVFTRVFAVETDLGSRPVGIKY
jgi:hypothetical protein